MGAVTDQQLYKKAGQSSKLKGQYPKRSGQKQLSQPRITEQQPSKYGPGPDQKLIGAVGAHMQMQVISLCPCPAKCALVILLRACAVELSVQQLQDKMILRRAMHDLCCLLCVVLLTVCSSTVRCFLSRSLLG